MLGWVLIFSVVMFILEENYVTSVLHIRRKRKKQGDFQYLSFISSVSDVIYGRMRSPAMSTGIYETHKFIKGRGSSWTFYSVVFNNIMGLEDGTNHGVHVDDIKPGLRGHVKEGHTFNPVGPLSQDDLGFNVVVCVRFTNAPHIKSSVLEKMNNNDLFEWVSFPAGIPQIDMMTHIGEACGNRKKLEEHVQEQTPEKEDFSAVMGIPMNCIFPVKNYSEEINAAKDINTLILSALRTITDFENDFIEEM
uniref:Uncharacterized protein n=1 Tax=Cyprinodon variegatus TaxID=28743 RepID=A0A3Q2CKK3_CYPVA